MKYEFGKATWIEENPDGNVSHQTIEQLHQNMENKIRVSIEKLLESQDNFLGKGMTAEVHFLDSDPGLCYKIIRKTEVMVRPDSVDSLPGQYREIYDRKEKEGKKEETWHVDLFDEAGFMSRARKVDPDGPVKIPRPDARLIIIGKEEGEGYEVKDELEVLLMETMDAISVDDLMRKGILPPENFKYDDFCRNVGMFLEAMHANKLFHRDFHAGNVMIDRTTGNPVVIDFGRSTLSVEDEAYIDEVKPGKKMHFIRDEQMFRDKIKTPLAEYLAYQKLTESNK